MSFHNVLAEPHRSLALETKAEGDPPADDPVQTALTALSAKMDQVLSKLEADVGTATEEAKAAKQAVTALETKMNRPGGGAPDKGATLEQKAFRGFVRRGRESLEVDEIKALRVADNTAGGYLAPGEWSSELLKNLVQFSPVREAARVGSMSAGDLKIPRRLSGPTAKWVDEIETRSKTEPVYGELKIEAHEMSCWVPVSNQLLEDAAFNIEAELSADFAEEFGRLEGAAFVAGTGIKQPRGLLVDPDVKVMPSGAANAITPEGLLKLLYDLPPIYRNAGSWMLNGGSIAAIRLMKDTTGRFLWQESLAEGQPPTLLGRPVVEAIDMPDAEAGATPILYGDFATAYRVYDRVGLSILRDPYTLSDNGMTKFTARRRVAGSVVRPEALRKLRIAAN